MTSHYMRSGVFLAPFHRLDENLTLCFTRDLELVEHLDRLNYHEVWFGEHHSAGVETIASPELMIAAAAERTKHIRLGTGVLSLPYHNPYIVTDRMVQLDHMTRGRAMFGVGPGALVYDAHRIGVKPSEQRRMMTEALDVIMRLLRGEVVNEKTDWYELNDARLQYASYTQPMIEMAVAGSISPNGALAAGSHGIGLLSIGGTTPQAIAKHTSNWNFYEAEAKKNGHVADRSKWRITTMFHIAETREQARKNVEFGLKQFRDYSSDVSTFPIIPEDVTDPYQYLVDTGAACIGTPDDAIAYINRLIEVTGGYGVITELAHDWADWTATFRHYELMARFVHPHFQGVNHLRKESYSYASQKKNDFVQHSRAAVQAEIDKHKAAG